MKKLLALILSAVMLVSLTACGKFGFGKTADDDAVKSPIQKKQTQLITKSVTVEDYINGLDDNYISKDSIVYKDTDSEKFPNDKFKAAECIFSTMNGMNYEIYAIYQANDPHYICSLTVTTTIANEISPKDEECLMRDKCFDRMAECFDKAYVSYDFWYCSTKGENELLKYRVVSGQGFSYNFNENGISYTVDLQPNNTTMSIEIDTDYIEESYIFGAYEQDNDFYNGKEKIEWTVLAKEGNKALLISDYALDCQQYDETNFEITWENSSIRKWLNEKFLNDAFSEDEQKIIQNTIVSDVDNQEYHTKSSNETTDKIFLLSILEVERYLSNGPKCGKCLPTKYAISQGSLVGGRYYLCGQPTCSWWLRSLKNRQTVAQVDINGKVDVTGANLLKCVRPALWVELATESPSNEEHQTTVTNAGQTWTGTFTLEVTFADGTIKTQTYSYEMGRGIMLGYYLQQEGVIVCYTDKYKNFAKTVMGQTLDYDTDQMYWALYINGESAPRDIYSTKIKDGATYALRPEKAQ